MKFKLELWIDRQMELLLHTEATPINKLKFKILRKLNKMIGA